MKLIEASVKRPVATGVIFAFICGAGFFAWSRLPQEIMPNLQFPQLTIVTNYLQAAPEEIENIITRPIEEAVGTVQDLRSIESVSKEGTSVINVKFNWGTSMDFASLNLREKLDLVKSRLPREISEPLILRYNPFEAPILILSFQSQEPMDPLFLSRIAKKNIANKLQKVDGVAAIDVAGVREKEFQIDLDQSRLAANRVSLLKFIDGVAQANYSGAAGTAKEGSYDYAVRVLTKFENSKDIESAIVAVDSPSRSSGRDQKRSSIDRRRQRASQGDQRLISIGQLGRVSEGLKQRTSFSRYDSKENLTIQVQKQASASTIQTVKRVREALRELAPLLPANTTLAIVYDQAELIQKGIRDVLFAVIGGGVFAFLTLLLFLKNVKDAVIVSLVIPTSTLATVILMKLFGISLNTISLGGLALGVGMLVDSAICVVENINRRKNELKESRLQSAIHGTSEVAGAITASSLTTIAVFFPLVFVIGLLGQLFKDLSFTVTISLIISILVSLTLVPMLSVLLPDGDSQRKENWVHVARSHYMGALQWGFDRPKFLWFLLAIVFGMAVLLLMVLPKQFLPNVDTNQLVARINMPNGTILERTNDIAKTVTKEINSLEEVDHVMETVGSSGDSPLKLLGKHQAQILVDLKKERSRRAELILDELREKMSGLDLKGGRVEFSKVGGPLSFVRSGSSPIMLQLKGSDLAKLSQESEKIVMELKDVPGLVDVQSSLSLPAPEIRMKVNKERAARTGLTVADIGKTAMAAYHGRVATTIYRQGEEIPVRVRLRESDRQSIGQLRSLLIASKEGNGWPMKDVASIEIGEGPSQIERVDQQRSILIRANINDEFSSASQSKIEEMLEKDLGFGLSLEMAGDKAMEKKSFGSLVLILIVSVLLVYMVMSVQFESLKQPFFILFTIPLAAIGMAFGLFAAGKTISVMAAMGLLLLAGIVVNNGIVLIDFVNNTKKEASNLKEALRLACQNRFRPILITAATTVMGLIPLALGLGEGAELQAPMAITVIFGLAVSTVLTLVALPTLFVLTQRRSEN